MISLVKSINAKGDTIYREKNDEEPGVESSIASSPLFPEPASYYRSVNFMLTAITLSDEELLNPQNHALLSIYNSFSVADSIVEDAIKSKKDEDFLESDSFYYYPLIFTTIGARLIMRGFLTSSFDDLVRYATSPSPEPRVLQVSVPTAESLAELMNSDDGFKKVYVEQNITAGINLLSILKKYVTKENVACFTRYSWDTIEAKMLEIEQNIKESKEVLRNIKNETKK